MSETGDRRWARLNHELDNGDQWSKPDRWWLLQECARFRGAVEAHCWKCPDYIVDYPGSGCNICDLRQWKPGRININLQKGPDDE